MGSKNKVEIKKEMWDFVLWNMFGISSEDMACSDPQRQRAIAKKCADTAFLDLRRTLRYNDQGSKPDRKAFRDKINGIIADALSELLDKTEQGDFDEIHNEICEEIIEATKNSSAIKSEEFHYGHAQKWLNMTLKYMYLLGLWEEEFERVIPWMHVPVDSYILKAAAFSESKLMESSECCIELKCCLRLTKAVPEIDKDESGQTRYSSYGWKSKSWSRWNREEYCHFQSELRKAISEKGTWDCPFFWEEDAWIEQAQLDQK